ncbi:MAG: 4Fe-4S binding protein [Chloroflexota bacterium]
MQFRALRRRPRLTDTSRLRKAVQIGMAAYLLVAGWQFYQFVLHFETGGVAPLVARPPAVEAFLPISALVAAQAALGGGGWDRVHPAGLAILLAALLTALLAGRGLCAWLCPIGTLSEALWRAGRLVVGRSVRLPRIVDWALQSIKYLVLLFFLKSVFFDLGPVAAAYFLRTSYNQVADVKMLAFFRDLAPEVGAFLLVIAVVSLAVPNAWCRYLCPYGALLGLLGVFAPVTIRRDESRCTGCGRCARACAEGIRVDKSEALSTPLCTRCLDCVVVCTQRGALAVVAPAGRRLGGTRAYALVFMGLFFGALVLAQLAGYWETSVDHATYARLIPKMDILGHP